MDRDGDKSSTTVHQEDSSSSLLRVSVCDKHLTHRLGSYQEDFQDTCVVLKDLDVKADHVFRN